MNMTAVDGFEMVRYDGFESVPSCMEVVTVVGEGLRCLMDGK